MEAMIDWNNLDVLIGPRWRARDVHDRERLANAKQHQRGGHKTGKNHSTSKEAAAVRRAGRTRLMTLSAHRDNTRAAYHAAVRAYWTGDSDEHPVIESSALL